MNTKTATLDGRFVHHRYVQWINVTAVGTALFPVLTMCLQVPVFENYYLCLGYVVMAVCLYSFGTLSGTFVGTAGVILYCVLTNGLRGMPGWALGNVVIGLIVGTAFRLTRTVRNRWIRAAVHFLAIAVSAALGILIVKSLTESLLYAQPMAVRIGKNVFAFAADIFVLEVSLPVCFMLEAPLEKLRKQR